MERAEQLTRAKHAIEMMAAYDYYLHLWDDVKHNKPLEDCTREELLMPFQLLWEALPDNTAIRRPPFFEICDLAEEFVNGDEE